ncbi:hypothetical protein DFJ74DRAFT_604886 [Hyaloraphidium curvatum]|nr:hypothetical protein DFJ74DRAFT_604886 [Hyaloraphidium curvatum]
MDEEIEAAQPANEAPIAESDDDAPPPREVPEGNCAECEDHPADVDCSGCGEKFCDVCFAALHRKGRRAAHEVARLRPEAPPAAAPAPAANGSAKRTASDRAAEEAAGRADAALAAAALQDVGEYFVERSKYIPVRLTLNERKYLRLLEAALDVSEYTDKIDVLTYSSKTKKMVAQIRELCSILAGLVVACDFQVGQELFKDRDFATNEDFFQNVFELGRRHKTMNPEKMRTTYGKLMYILMDSQIPEVKEQLGFNCVRPIRTVHSTLEAAGALPLLRDPLVATATMEISPAGKPRHVIQSEIRAKERAIEALARRYARPDAGLGAEDVRQALYSIGDNHAFLRFARDPCDEMAGWLGKYFRPDEVEQGWSLAITSGLGGARLTHDHTRQFHYVSQTLALWREIANETFMLWYLADRDMLDAGNPYRLRDTGQGLNRMQACPGVSRAMQIILGRAQRKLGYWVGSSVVHLGDTNVPNALNFVDKYSQVPRILLPICSCLRNVDKLMKNEGLARYVDSEFDGPEILRKTIARDFFRHAFDGSGALDYFSAGSCIDGRLTSAWNWCQLVEKRRYFPAFQLDPAWLGFDGKW